VCKGSHAQPVTVFAPLRPTFGQLPVWRLPALALLQPSLRCLSFVRHLPSRHGLIFLSMLSAALPANNKD